MEEANPKNSIKNFLKILFKNLDEILNKWNLKGEKWVEKIIGVNRL